MVDSRTNLAVKNVMWAYVNMAFTTILKFVVRWAFIKTIGVVYLGINGLYASVLGVLSLTELGIGSAMNYSLYKPVAENNQEKIKSLMQLYKRAYSVIAVIILCLGLALIPFLGVLVKGADSVDHLVLYYLLFLFNAVSSYFVSYKYGLVIADQRNYLINNIHTIATTVSGLFQVAVLFVYKSFIAYLLISIFFQLLEKISTSLYIDKKYPYLKEKCSRGLQKEEKKSLYKNVKALFIHKFGDVAVNQTDNLIISSFLNVTITGLVSNYTLVTSTVDSFLSIVFSNITGSLGNLCATENKTKQYEIYKIYEYVDFWLFGFSAIAYSSLIQPFTELMWGKENVVDFWPIMLIIINTYIVGQRIPLNNMKIARGIFVNDKYLAFFQAIINLVSSILFVKKYGLVGVYMGTILSGLIPTIFRPLLVYEEMFDRPIGEYYFQYLKRLLLILFTGFVNYFITDIIMTNLSLTKFVVSVVLTALIPNLIILCVTKNSDEYLYVKDKITSLFKTKKKVFMASRKNH